MHNSLLFSSLKARKEGKHSPHVSCLVPIFLSHIRLSKVSIDVIGPIEIRSRIIFQFSKRRKGNKRRSFLRNRKVFVGKRCLRFARLLSVQKHKNVTK